jgi:hypothetical protein
MDWTPIELKQWQRHETRRAQHQHKAKKGWLPTMVFGTVGTMSIGIGILEMGAGQLTELSCRRSSQPRTIFCTRTITTGLTRETPLLIDNITGAEMQRVGRKFRNAYRVLLITGEQTIPMTEDFKSDQRDKEQQITQINRYIRDPKLPDLELLEDDRAQSNLFGLMFIAAGFLGILMAWVVQFSVHRKVDLTKVKKSNLSR